MARPSGLAIDDEARGHDAIALMGTIGSIWMLRADGTFWDADADSGKPLTPLAEEWHTMALVAGVERYAWLAELLPPRPPGAEDCEVCAGAGVVFPANALPDRGAGLFCPHCGALGWRG